MQVINFLEGKKTHIIAAVLVVLNVIVALGLVSPAHLVQINIVLGALGLSALHAAINR